MIFHVNLPCFQTIAGRQYFRSKITTAKQDSYIKFCIFDVIMEEFLRIVEEPLSTSAEVTIDADRLKFFTTKVEIWEYAKIPASDFQKLSFDDRASILKHYYSDMSAKYSVSAAILFIYLFFYSGSCASYFLQQNCYSAH